MDFSIDDLRGVSTIFCMVAFAAIVFWAYGPSRKQYFDKAAALPFEDETDTESEVAGKVGK
jgi:cytochrome c oxidase cbb3-type subunit IV